MKIRIGTELLLTPNTGDPQQKAVPGAVVYINKPHRYFMAEFKTPFGIIRESFKFALPWDLPQESRGSEDCLVYEV